MFGDDSFVGVGALALLTLFVVMITMIVWNRRRERHAVRARRRRHSA